MAPITKFVVRMCLDNILDGLDGRGQRSGSWMEKHEKYRLASIEELSIEN